MLVGVLPVSRSGLVLLLGERLCTCHSFAGRSLFAIIHPSKVLVNLFNREFVELSSVPGNNSNPNLLRFSPSFQPLRPTSPSSQKGLLHREIIPIFSFKNFACRVTASP